MKFVYAINPISRNSGCNCISYLFYFHIDICSFQVGGGGGCLAMVQNRLFVNTHYISKCYLYIIAGFVITETVFQ